MRRLGTICILLLVAACGTAACSPPTPEPTETTVVTRTPEKTGEGELRTDLAPIAKRYPQLAVAESIEWMGGTTGTSDLGPSTYWVDVVAVLPEAEIDSLLDRSAVSEIDAPHLVDGMAPKVPSGPFVGSTALDALFSEAGRSATVAIDPTSGTVVLSGLFE